MSLFRDGTKPHDLGLDRLKPVPGTPILRASVEVPRKRVIDLCTGVAAPTGARERILSWLAEGAREVTWALCSLPRERWAEAPRRDWVAGQRCAMLGISRYARCTSPYLACATPSATWRLNLCPQRPSWSTPTRPGMPRRQSNQPRPSCKVSATLASSCFNGSRLPPTRRGIASSTG